jgi:threonine efflux protein
MLQAYLITLVGVALAQAAPGPDLMAVASAAFGQGRRAALFTVLGVASGMFIWAAGVAFGLAAVLTLFPKLMTAMKLIGGGYLAYLAIRALIAAAKGGEAQSIRALRQPMSAFAAWRRGLIVVMTNPKAALAWTAVGTFLFGSGLSPLEVAGFGPVAAASAVLVYGTYALLFSTGLAARTYSRFARVFEAAFGAAFGLIGGRLLLDGIRDLRG